MKRFPRALIYASGGRPVRLIPGRRDAGMIIALSLVGRNGDIPEGILVGETGRPPGRPRRSSREVSADAPGWTLHLHQRNRSQSNPKIAVKNMSLRARCACAQGKNALHTRQNLPMEVECGYLVVARS